MDNYLRTNEYGREKVSFSCIVVAAVFFLVLSQFIVLRVPEIVTQLFRPAIIFFLLIKMQQRKVVSFPAGKYAVFAAIYCCIVLLLNSINTDEIMDAGASVLYFLMFAAVIGTNWNKAEIKFIIKAVFFAAFTCAIVVMLSNPITDLSYATNNDISMFGKMVNRNKNAYAFAIGTVVGAVYLINGKNIPKILVFLLTLPIAYCLLYSQCRGAFACAVVAVFVVVGSNLMKLRRINAAKFLSRATAFVLLCIVAYFLIKNSALSRLIDGDNMSGRDDGIKHAWGLFVNSDLFSKIFGHGFMYETNNTEGAISHLVYTQYALSTGIIGVSMIIMMLVSTGYKIKGSISYAFFFAASLRTLFESLDYYNFIPLILSVIIFNYSKMYKRPESDVFSR